ncbi:MAG: WYL domain-containing protein, partial [Cyanobacteria bacterium]|nr:WYL domain-containing protein [Cyanobacteriota bacterium]
DGSCTLEFMTQSFDEVKRWVLPFGCGAEVIDPPDLRRRVMEELKQTLRGYGVSAN